MADNKYLRKILTEGIRDTNKQPYYEVETGYYDGEDLAILEAMKTIHNIAITKAGKCKDKNEIEKLRL